MRKGSGFPNNGGAQVFARPGSPAPPLPLGPSCPRIMAVLNLTPDSFSDGGHYMAVDRALDRASELEEEGAEILDLGAESTRPGSEAISADEECDRLLPVLGALRERTQLPLSIDTTKSVVARAALERGADWINDISGLRFDKELGHVAADFEAPIVLMHSRGTPQTMQEAPFYEDVLVELRDELSRSVERALEAGVREEKILLDPGIGFAKRHEDNLRVLRGLSSLHELGFPILLGASRKSTVARLLLDSLGRESRAEERDVGTLAIVAEGDRQGVAVHRVHAARYAREFLSCLRELRSAP